MMNRMFVGCGVPIMLLAGAAFAAEPAGRMVSATGQILVMSQGKEARPLKVGDPIVEGDTLKSDAVSSAKFLMNDQTILDLNASSQLHVEHYQLKSLGNRDVDISVEGGTVRASVNQHLTKGGKFQIRTRTATMGVRGTEFIVYNDTKSGTSQLTVLKGLVQAASDGSAPMGVAPGNQWTLPLGAPPQLVKLSPEDLAQITRGATVRDATFTSAVEIRKSSARSTSAAATSALTAVRTAAARSPASQSSGGGAATASIPGNTDSLHGLRSQSALLQVQNIKLKVGFSP